MGIDLGTTNSGVAYIDDAGKCISIPLGQDRFTFPSTITIDKKGKWLVGAHQAGLQPMSALHFAFLTKRVLGRQSNDGKLRSDLEGLPFELSTTGDVYINGQNLAGKCSRGVRLTDIVAKLLGWKSQGDTRAIHEYIGSLLPEDNEQAGNGEAGTLADELCQRIGDPLSEEWESILNEFLITEPLFEAGGELLHPEELTALILMEAKRVAEAHLGKRIQKCVIAIPAYFTDSQRQATRDAARIAGLEIVRLVNEPSAAAIAYAEQGELQDGLLLVGDIGGGTFDASLLRFENQKINRYVVKATGGDNSLGGVDFTNVLQGLVYEKTGLNKDDPEVARKVLAAAEDAKRRLAQGEGEVEVEVCGHEPTVTVDEFREKCAPIFERITGVLNDTLKERREFIQQQAAHSEGEDVEKPCGNVLLFGGATSTPGYQEIVRNATEGTVLPLQDVSLLVQQGSAYVGADRALLTQVTGRGLGIRTTDGGMEVIVHRNEPLPAESTKIFRNAGDFAEEVKIVLFEGENKFAKDNIRLGEFFIGIPPRPKGKVSIPVTIHVTIDGCIEVTAYVADGGGQESLKVARRPKFDDDELDRLKKINLARFETRYSKKRPREDDGC